MNSLLFYLLQVMLVSGVLYGYYHLMLRNKKFHQYNRFYLLSTLIISVLIPFLSIPVYLGESDIESSVVLQTLQNISSASQGNEAIVTDSTTADPVPLNWSIVWYIVYLLAASILFFRILVSLKKIRRIIKNNPVEELEGVHVVNTAEPGTPYSFFRWLFWNKKIELSSEKGRQIFRHEIFHIQQKHSLDVLLFELVSALLWFNPFFHFMKKEIRAIHEFLADRFASHKTEKWKYAELLLMQALNTKQHLVNPFFHNQVKRRIAMITTSKKPAHQYLRKLLVMPVTAVITALFAFSYQVKEAEDLNENSQHAINGNLLGSDSTKPPGDQVMLNGHFSLSKVDAAGPNSASKIIVNGKQVIINELTLDGSETLKIDSAEIYFNPGSGNETDTVGKPLIILDGKKQTWNAASEILKYLDPAVVQTVNVLKGSSAMIKYGEDAKYGAIEINTRKNDNNEIIEIIVDKQITSESEVIVEKQMTAETVIKVDKQITAETEINVDKQKPDQIEIKVDKQMTVETEINVNKQKPAKIIDVKVQGQKPAKIIDVKVEVQKPAKIIDVKVEGQKPAKIIDIKVDKQKPPKIIKVKADQQKPVEIIDKKLDS